LVAASYFLTPTDLQSLASFQGCSWGEIDLAQDRSDEPNIPISNGSVSRGRFPYAAFFWPALVAASAAETASSMAAHFLEFSGDAGGDRTPQEPERATPSKIALELHADRLIGAGRALTCNFSELTNILPISMSLSIE
jgi:hypothetical protein